MRVVFYLNTIVIKMYISVPNKESQYARPIILSQ